MLCRISGASAVGPITTVGPAAPLGKCCARASNPLTESARSRNCSVCESPIPVPASPVAETASTASAAVHTTPGRRETASATRCQIPVVAIGALPIWGMNGQNTFRPHHASSGGSTNSTNTAATTRPQPAQRPRLRVLGVTASVRVSSASTTVALLARIAGAAAATARRNALRCSGSVLSSSR